ncbi:ABC transporter permease [Sporosarcina sp. OR05]|uniref:ABC transporter permease n=1 Tax=Sporosarcina sp. OR05 TaxID=2969819 RepID=UPI00352BC683
MKRLTYKLLSSILTLFIVTLLIFFMFQVLPGNPAQIILGIDADEAQIKQLEQKLGLDEPLTTRYMQWVQGIFTGDLGESLKYQMPVMDVLKQRVPVTLALALSSLVITALIALPLGMFIAMKQDKWYAFVVNLFTQLGIAIPSFWFGFLLIYLFGVKLGWFPTFGYTAWSENPMRAIQSFILPSIAIAVSNIAVVTRYLRNTILDQTTMDYVRTAKSKGVKDHQVMSRHIVRNAFIPVLTIMGMIVADTIAGSIIIENVFALPGLGNLLIQSITSRDFPLIQALVSYIAIFVIVINIVIDLLYRIIDPRIKKKG